MKLISNLHNILSHKINTYNYNRKKSIQKSIKQPERFYIQWHLLDNCNLRCAHCYQENAILRKMNFSDIETVFEKLDEFFKDKNYLPQINLTGGEPLLHNDLFKIIDLILERNWKWALLTNGTLLTNDLAQKIYDRNPVFVQVSLEGGKEVNDSCRGEGSFEKICNAMDILVSNKIKCLVSFTITSKNWMHFPEVADICCKHNIYKLWCDRYVGNDDLKISTEDFASFLKILETTRKNNNSSTIIAADRALMFMAGGSCYSCNAGGSLLIILPDGTLLPCRRLPLELGNICGEQSIQSILDNSVEWQKLNHIIYPTKCISCPDLRKCKGGAKCVTFAQTNDYTHCDVNCPR